MTGTDGEHLTSHEYLALHDTATFYRSLVRALKKLCNHAHMNSDPAIAEGADFARRHAESWQNWENEETRTRREWLEKAAELTAEVAVKYGPDHRNLRNHGRNWHPFVESIRHLWIERGASAGPIDSSNSEGRADGAVVARQINSWDHSHPYGLKLIAAVLMAVAWADESGVELPEAQDLDYLARLFHLLPPYPDHEAHSLSHLTPRKQHIYLAASASRARW